MPKLKRDHVSPTPEEDAAINVAIKDDPDTREMTDADFARARGGRALNEGKTRITIWLDNEVVAAFKARSAEQGKGYQTLVNETLRNAISPNAGPITEDVLRRILREELQHT